MKVGSFNHVRIFVTPWTVAYQTLAFMGFSRKEYWSGLSFPSPGDLPDRGIEPGCPAFQADALTSEPPGKPIYMYIYICVQFSSVQFSLSVMSDSATPLTVAYHASPSVGFSRQEYWSGLSFPSPGDLPNPGVKPVSPTLYAVSLPLSHLGSPYGQCRQGKVVR